MSRPADHSNPQDRVRRRVASAVVVLAGALLLGAGNGRATAPAAIDTIRALPVTPALKAQVRAGFYRAYRADPKEFGVPAGRPVSAFFVPFIEDAGVLATATPADISAWVVGAVCLRSNPVPCQDAGGFQVFYRTGPAGPFAYLPDGLCALPAALAGRWFPGGRYPLGIRCPAGEALVQRGGLRTGVWTGLVPRSWTRVPCGAAAAAKLDQSLCSYEGGDTDIDVWFNPADRNELLEVVTCRGGDCFPIAKGGGPRLVASPGETRIADWELSFHASPGTVHRSAFPSGSGAISGLFLAAHSGGMLSYPVYTVEVELPPGSSALATAIVDNFAACLKPGETLAGSPGCR